MNNGFLTETLDKKAKLVAKNYLKNEGELLSVLIEMRKQRVFAELNYTGIFDYCERALGLSRAQAYYFKAVAEKAEEVPQIKEAVIKGELTLSQARRIASVVTLDNHRHWIEKAQTLRQIELEQEVTLINPKAHVIEKIKPVAKELSELKVAVDKKTEENLLNLKEILSQKLGKPASLSDVISWMAEITLEKFDPVRKAQRISLRKFPTVRTTAKAHPTILRKSIASHLKVHRQSICASTKHQLNIRDQVQCSYISPDGRRCAQKRWLDAHHIVPVSNGGTNALSNLRLLCRAHHAHTHAGKSIS